MNWHYIEPLDVLLLRGNKLFGDPGSYGEALVPPWPSVAAGAIRAAILVRDKTDLTAFGKNEIEHDSLGTPETPGSFAIRSFSLAQKTSNGYEAIHVPPADLVIAKKNGGDIVVNRLQPQKAALGIDSSSPTEKQPVLKQAVRSKPVGDYWLNDAGYRNYLDGKTPANDQILRTKKLWHMDERVGVGLDTVQRRAEDGKLFTVQAVALCENTGFLAASEGDSLKQDTLLRLGGDGRAALCRGTDYQPPAIDLERLVEAKCCRIVLTTPGIFPDGWRLPGTDEDGNFELMGIQAKVVAAAVNRAEVISGWDLARKQPKDAQRAVPTGSVYWLEGLNATAEQMRKLVDHGLWPQTGYDKHRKAEGFNRFNFAIY